MYGKRKKRYKTKVVEIGAKSKMDFRAIGRLARTIKKSHPDIVHVHHTLSAFLGPLFAKTLTEALVIRTEHNNQRHYSILQNIIHWVSQALADHVLCNSKDTYENLYPPQKWAIGENWDVVYNGVDVSRIQDASSREVTLRMDPPGDRIVIGSVGRLVDQKNYRRLIQAIPSVLEEVPKAHLILIGDGENRSTLEEEATAQGVEQRVTFAGELPRDDVYAALHQFDLFVMPSLWEGFCNAVVEAMAAGLPVVCSDISTLREVVGDAALYANPSDPSDIGRAIIELLKSDLAAQKKWGERARRRATERYTIERTAEKYVETYFKVVGKSSA